MLGAVLAGCAVAGSGSAISGAGSSAATRARVDSSMRAAINQARSRGRKCGSVFHPAADPVAWNDMLGIAALKHSRDMASQSFLSHTGSDDTSSDERLTREGYAWRTCGENIAVGQPSTAAVVQSWLSSEGHCRNIMSPDFHEIGAAYAIGPYQGMPSAKYWTLVLGTAR
jgi:uncharacterized protein YkwD